MQKKESLNQNLGISKVEINDIKRGDIIIIPPTIQSMGLLAGHSMVATEAADRNGHFYVHHSASDRDGSKKERESKDYGDIKDLEKYGAQVFRIDDGETVKSFMQNLEQTKINYSIGKVITNTLRDWFSSKDKKIDDVADRIAKYYFNSHLGDDPSKAANNFCSQYTYQCLQNAAMEKIVGKEALGVRRSDSTLMDDKDDFEKWKAKHIGKIKEAVKKFPPELKHVSSSISPSNLIDALQSLSEKNQQQGVSKSDSFNAPKDEKKGFFARIFEGFKSLFSGSKKDKVEPVEKNSSANNLYSPQPSSAQTGNSDLLPFNKEDNEEFNKITETLSKLGEFEEGEIPEKAKVLLGISRPASTNVDREL